MNQDIPRDSCLIYEMEAVRDIQQHFAMLEQKLAQQLKALQEGTNETERWLK